MKKPFRSLLAVAALVIGAWRPWRILARFEISERSMSPTLEPGDYVITRRAAHRLARGDVVFLAAGSRYLVKRIVGLPGERVVIDAGILSIDHQPLDEPWWSGASRPDGAWDLPQNGYFVLGDNRSASRDDSRARGPIMRDTIDSVVIARYWPVGRMGRITGSSRLWSDDTRPPGR